MLLTEEQFTISECGPASLITSFEALLPLMIPAVIFACLWRICLTSKSPKVISLGLSDESEVFAPVATKQIETSVMFLYLLISVSTFTIGVLTYKLTEAITVALKELAAK